jgi:hypothetical protein
MRSNNVDERARINNGNGRYQSGGGFVEDLEAPTWKPRRMTRATNSNGGREDKFGRTFRRGDNEENPRNTYKEVNVRWAGTDDDSPGETTIPCGRHQICTVLRSRDPMSCSLQLWINTMFALTFTFVSLNLCRQ